MASLKRFIAATIICFKPHVFLTLCILLVIAHSVIIAVHKSATSSWRIGRHQQDLTLTMTTVILFVALTWAAFSIYIVRFELRNELETLLILFQCSKRGLRFLGVVAFHWSLLIGVTMLVSAAVERSIPSSLPSEDLKYYPIAGERDRSYLLTVYKIWLTAIVYSFLYLLAENTVMFYTDMTLIEFIHAAFLTLVARLTGIDLSDYPAGEMLFNPLVRRRFA